MAPNHNCLAYSTTAIRKRSLRWLCIAILCVAVAGGLYLAYPTFKQWRAINAVSAATTPAEEQKAFLLVNETRAPYEIRFFDAIGTMIRPYIAGDYTSVTSVEIIWPNGRSVKTAVRDSRNLITLMGD